MGGAPEPYGPVKVTSKSAVPFARPFRKEGRAKDMMVPRATSMTTRTAVLRSFLAAIILLPVLLIAAPAGAQVTGLTIVEDTVFTVGEVDVVVESTVTITNTTTDRVDGNTVYYSYYADFVTPVPIGATGLSISSGGSELAVTFEPMGDDPDFQFANATLPSQLRSGQTTTIELSFQLPAGDLRGDGLFVSNPAFHGFPMWSNSDPGTGSLELRAPMEASLSEFGDELKIVGIDDDQRVWQPTNFEDPQNWYTYVTVQDRAARVQSSLSVAGQEILLRAFPGDSEWIDFATVTIDEGLPALETVIGIPVPEQQTLEVVESIDPYLLGFAGWYNLGDTSIEVGNELDDSVMLHELSHAWFNDDLFASRWIAEGLAEEFTAQAQGVIGWEPNPLPDAPSMTDPVAQPLNGWEAPPRLDLEDDESEIRDRWGYAASWYVMNDLVSLVGLETMQEVIQAAADDEISYVDGEPETWTTTRGWEQFLDLVVERSDDPAVTGPAVTAVFNEFVLEANDVDQLEERAAARGEYADFAAAELGWDIPATVRRPMSDWRFDDAMAAIEAAEVVQARQIEVAAAAEAAGLSLSDTPELLYETSENDLAGASIILDRQESGIAAVMQLREHAGSEKSFTARWGIGDTDLDSFVTDAETALAEDRFDDLEAAQAEFDEAVADAESRGRKRLLVLGGLVIAAVLLILVLLALRRRHRKWGWARPDDPSTDSDIELPPLVIPGLAKRRDPSQETTTDLTVIPDVVLPDAKVVVPTPPPVPDMSREPAIVTPYVPPERDSSTLPRRRPVVDAPVDSTNAATEETVKTLSQIVESLNGSSTPPPVPPEQPPPPSS